MNPNDDKKKMNSLQRVVQSLTKETGLNFFIKFIFRNPFTMNDDKRNLKIYG